MVDGCPRCYADSRPRRRLLSLAASPDAQGDINDSDERPDRLQAANIKAVLELKGFDLGMGSSHCAHGGRKLQFSPSSYQEVGRSVKDSWVQTGWGGQEGQRLTSMARQEASYRRLPGQGQRPR